MRRYPPSTRHRYPDLPSTQRIQTHNSHRHNTTPPFQTLVQAPYTLPPTPPLPPQTKHRHTSNTPLFRQTGLVKPKPNSLIHSPPSSLTPARAKHIHISHTPPTPHIPRTTLTHNTAAALDTMYEPRVPPTCPALTILIHPPHQHCRKHRTFTLSQQTHIQYKLQYTHHSHSNHRIHIGYHDNLTDRPKTTT